MRGVSTSRSRFAAPAWGYLPAFVMALVCVMLAPASAQPKKGDKSGQTKAPAGHLRRDARRTAAQEQDVLLRELPGNTV